MSTCHSSWRSPRSIRLKPSSRRSRCSAGQRLSRSWDTQPPCSACSAFRGNRANAGRSHSAIPIASSVTPITGDGQIGFYFYWQYHSKTGGTENAAHNFGWCRDFCCFGPQLAADRSLRGALVRGDLGRRWRHALGLPLSLDRRMPTERALRQSWLVQPEPLLRPGRKTSKLPPSPSSAISIK